MAVVRGLQAWRYSAKAGPIASLIAPPYDIISPAQAKALRARSPYNVIHLELPEGPEDPGVPRNRYQRSADLFRAWGDAGILARDPEPSLYLYAQDFSPPGSPQGESVRRLGVLAALRLEPYETGSVRPHEQTFPKHKEDRFQLLTAARAQFSPIMAMYPAGDANVRAELEAATTAPPAAGAEDDDGVTHSLWVNRDPRFADRFGSLLAEREVFIADGHHRYETALRYQASRRGGQSGDASEWYDFIMVYLLAMEDPGLALLPTHRMVRGLPVDPPREIRRRLLESGAVSAVPEDPVDPACAVPDGTIRLVVEGMPGVDLTPHEPSPLATLEPSRPAAWRELEAVILHRLVLERILGAGPETEITYTRDAGEAVRGVRSGEWQAAFLLPAPRVDQVRAISLAGERMPEKTTYFWPKAYAGLVIHGDG